MWYVILLKSTFSSETSTEETTLVLSDIPYMTHQVQGKFHEGVFLGLCTPPP
jgi:hypothetical protein